MRKISILVLKAVVSAGLLAILFSQLDTAALARAARAVDPLALVVAVVIALGQFCLASLRWVTIGRVAGMSLTWFQALRLICAAMFFGLFLPTSIGGDAVRAWLARRQGVSIRHAVSTVILDRGAGLLSLMILMLVTGFVVADRMPPGGGADLVRLLPLLALLAAGLTIGLSESLARFVDRWRLARPLAVVLRDLDLLRRGGLATLLVMLLSLALHGATALCVWLLASGSGVVLPFIEVVGLLPPAILLTVLPVSIAGWGVREAAVVTMFVLLAQSAEQGLLVSLLWGGTTLLAALVGGGFWAATGGYRPADGRLT